MSDHARNNSESRARLDRIAKRLTKNTRVDDTWTAAALLAHVAFWDRIAAARWQHEPPITVRIDDPIVDLVNAAMLPVWRTLSLADAIREATDAAAAIDDAVARASTKDIEAARLVSVRFIDRSGHRNEHLEQIERALR